MRPTILALAGNADLAPTRVPLDSARPASCEGRMQRLTKLELRKTGGGNGASHADEAVSESVILDDDDVVSGFAQSRAVGYRFIAQRIVGGDLQKRGRQT